MQIPSSEVTPTCVCNLTIICLDNGLPPGWRLAIIWTNSKILLNGPLGVNISDISKEIPTFLFTKMRLKVSSAKWWPFCRSLHMSNKYHLTHFNSMNQSYIQSTYRKKHPDFLRQCKIMHPHMLSSNLTLSKAPCCIVTVLALAMRAPRCRGYAFYSAFISEVI